MPNRYSITCSTILIMAFSVGFAFGDATTYVDLQGAGASPNNTTANAAAPYVLWNTGFANGVDITSDFSFIFGDSNQYTFTFNVAGHNAGGNDLRMFTINDPAAGSNFIDGTTHPVIKETLVLRNGSALDFTISGVSANELFTMHVVEAIKPNQATGGGTPGSGSLWTLDGGSSVESTNIAQDNAATYMGSFTDLGLFTNIGSANGGADIAGTVTRASGTWNHSVSGFYFEVVTIPEPASCVGLLVASLFLSRRKR